MEIPRESLRDPLEPSSDPEPELVENARLRSTPGMTTDVSNP